MNKGVIRLQKGLLAIEAIVKYADLPPKQKLEDIQYVIDKVWNDDKKESSK